MPLLYKHILVLAGGLSLSTLFAQSPFSDAAFYLRGPVDRDGDGYLSRTAGEYLDVFHAGDPDDSRNVSCSSATVANMNALVIRTESVTDPCSKIAYTDVPCLYFSGALSVDQTLGQPAKVSLPTVPFKYSYTNDYSFALLFRCDGNYPNTKYHCILNLGCQWGSGAGNGLKFGYNGVGFRSGDCCLWFSFGGADLTLYTNELGQNVWISAVGVMDSSAKKLRFYYQFAGKYRTKVFDYPAACDNPAAEPVSTATIGSASWDTQQATSKAPETWLGSIANLAVWGRALSEAEAKAVLNGVSPHYWRFGEEDGTADEFVGSNDATVCTNSQTWASLPNAIAASGKDFTLAFPLDPVQTVTPSNPAPTLATLLTMAADSGSGVLRPFLNEQALGDIAFSPSKTQSILLDGSLLQNGNNILSLKLVSGGPAKVDCIRGGLNGWNVGYDNNGFSEFRSETANVYTLGVDAWNKFSRCVTSPGNGDIPLNFRVILSEDVLKRNRYCFEIKMRHAGSNHPNRDALAKMTDNGSTTNILSLLDVTSSFQTFTYRFHPGELTPGTNDFRIFRYDRETLSDWDPIDYLRFYPVHVSKGLVIVFL